MQANTFDNWVGRTETRLDLVTPAPVVGLSAALDRDDPAPNTGDVLPPLWHWLYFLPMTRHSELGPDGHTRRGGFLPPVELPRRMWAGGRLEFFAPLRIGDKIKRVSKIISIKHKQGRSGELLFILVRHEISGPNGLAITEEHDIVFRDHSKEAEAPPASTPAPANAIFTSNIHADDVLLFRYSALTFNAHRIHYDRRYVTEVEHYPGLIVHGPLIATMLIELLRKSLPHAAVKRFDFRAVSPLFDIALFSVNAVPQDASNVKLWAANSAGGLAMEATAQI